MTCKKTGFCLNLFGIKINIQHKWLGLLGLGDENPNPSFSVWLGEGIKTGHLSSIVTESVPQRELCSSSGSVTFNPLYQPNSFTSGRGLTARLPRTKTVLPSPRRTSVPCLAEACIKICWLIIKWSWWSAAGNIWPSSSSVAIYQTSGSAQEWHCPAPIKSLRAALHPKHWRWLTVATITGVTDHT